MLAMTAVTEAETHGHGDPEGERRRWRHDCPDDRRPEVTVRRLAAVPVLTNTLPCRGRVETHLARDSEK